MSVTGNTLFPLPETETAALCKKLGLVLGNASMYGMAHTVTASAQSAAYDALVGLLDLYGEIEWAMGPDGLLVNGKPVDTRGTGQVLVEQMRRGNVQNFAFCVPLDRSEFVSFLTILSAEPGSSVVAEGVESALARAGFRSIRVDKAVYARVGSKSPESSGGKMATGESGAVKMKPAAVRPISKDVVKGRIFDLDSELLGSDQPPLAEGLDAFASGGLDMAALAQTAGYVEQRKEIRKQHQTVVDTIRRYASDPARLEELRQQMLAYGLGEAEWTALLAESGVVKGLDRQTDIELKTLLTSVEELARQRDRDGFDPREMNHALKAIGREVDSLIQYTQGQTTTLAQRVDADRDKVAEIERQARERGVGLQLSREELLQNLAEINQELVQPLTTSSALLQMLTSGQMGGLSPVQRDLLETASEGMERLERLISYLQRISGFPVELSPDQGLLSEIYGGESADTRSGNAGRGVI